MEPPDELPAAAEEAELPVAKRVDVDYKSVMIEGVKMDSNTPLRTLRGACESLGLSKTGGKAVCLERLWKQLESQELIAAHAAQTCIWTTCPCRTKWGREGCTLF